MSFRQRDVVYVRLESPHGEIQRHPFLIISCEAAIRKENYYTGIMMTASQRLDHFTFSLTDSMFERPLGKKNCQFRLHILNSFAEGYIENLVSRMKLVDFRAVVDQIKEFVLAVDTTA